MSVTDSPIPGPETGGGSMSVGSSSTTPSVSQLPDESPSPSLPATLPPLSRSSPASRKSTMDKLGKFIMTHKALTLGVGIMALGLACMALVAVGTGGAGLAALSAILLSIGFVTYALSPQLEVVINEIIIGLMDDPVERFRNFQPVSSVGRDVAKGNLEVLAHVSSSPHPTSSSSSRLSLPPVSSSSSVGPVPDSSSPSSSSTPPTPPWTASSSSDLD